MNPNISADVERVSNEVRRYKAGELGEEEWRRFRLQNGIYGVRFQKNIQMIRVKIPFGELTADQLRVLGETAEIFSTGIGHVTTRQDIQFYWIALEAIPEVLRRLGEVDITTREASGNTVRNVTACHLAGVCKKEQFDVTPYAKQVSRYLMRNPISQNLPRKFKIAFSGCGDDCVITGINDVGAIAVVKEVDGQKVRGFRIHVGGGLGTPPRVPYLIEDFTPAKDLLLTIEAVLRIFDRLGNRENTFRARMKFIIEQLGIDEFRRVVQKERWTLRATKAGDPEMQIESAEKEKENMRYIMVKQPNRSIESEAVDAGFARWFKTNVVKQKQEGFYAVTVMLIGGDITARQLSLLADAAEKYSNGLVRTTIRQNVVLRWIGSADLHSLYQDLKKADLASPGADTICDVVGCPGADTCNLGVTRSHRLAMKLSEHLAASDNLMLNEDFKGVSIKVSGCPNACGQHHVATIGFFGSAQRIKGKMVPHYHLVMGGKVYDGSVRFGDIMMMIPAKKVPEAVSKILDTYRAQRQDGESFQSWVDRLFSERGE
ncbi:MAG: nitrite/sulfite reductase [Thaumarchaeota archaeon]|nr:nitrite/sulfite reductase [Nitrososphaerota archaeon]MCL5317496.1 nitrite/sulfite reductase [Nitrososphaerota archaeon]